MVDVTGKPALRRTARAVGFLTLRPETVDLVAANRIKKGNVLITAELAGVQAAKQTAQLIPLCHPLQMSHIQVDAQLEEKGVSVTCEARCTDRTGVEMEALTGVAVALLTVYDMCKAVDKNMNISEIRLVEKRKEETTR